MAIPRPRGPDASGQPRHTAVVGAGIVGLATAWTLRHRGHSVVLFDPNPPGSGLSAGPVRGFRLAHGTASAVRLAQRSLAGWRVWERQLGRPLLDANGLLVTGPHIKSWPRAMKAAGANFALLDGRARRSAFGCNGAIQGTIALYDPAAAAINAVGAVQVLLDAVTSSGGDVLRERVTAVEAQVGPVRHAVRVHSDHSVRDFDHVFICAGAGSLDLVIAGSTGLESAVVPRSYALAIPLSEAREAPAPMWMQHFGEDRIAWAQPTPDGRIAVGANWSTSDPGRTDGGGFRDALVYIAENMPFVSHALPVETMIAPVRLPSSASFAISSDGPVTMAVGNQLFKYAPLLGRLLADHVDDQAPLLPRGVPTLESITGESQLKRV
jgi:sarcosine oxidase